MDSLDKSFGGGVHMVFAAPRILLVDDEPHLLNSLKRVMNVYGYEPDIANGGREALVRIQQQHYDLILLDLCMPDVDGFLVMEFVISRGIDTTVIVVSGDTSINSAIKALRSGAYDFLRKPYEPEALLHTVENALGKRKLERENKNIGKRLEQSEKWYRYLVNNSPDLIYTLDEKGCFTFLNDRAESLLGYGEEELVGKHYSDIIHAEDVSNITHIFDERRTGERASRNVEVRLKCRPDTHRPRQFETRFVTMELNAMGMYDDVDPNFPGRFVGTYGVAKDVSDRKKAEETINYQAYHDLLTGLPNRILFKDRLSLAMAQAKRNSEMLVVMLLDLDRFKVVNDTLGHVIGDELLLSVGGRLRGCLREGDTLARLGGDEFTLLLPQVMGIEDAEQIAKKIISELERPFYIDNNELFISVSIGISLYPNDGETIDSLVKNADIAMYHTKSRSKNNYQFYSQSMNASFSERLSLENSMRKALERDEFRVFYQPQLNIRSGRIVGMEALIRWQHPSRGLLLPSDFIALAEETGLIVPIGEWATRTACIQTKAWLNAGIPPVRLAVNLSAQQIEQSHFVEKIMQTLHETSLDFGLLELEITESMIMQDVENTIVKLRKLSLAGVKISIDDFGTGYSSLSYLRKFPIHTLKIDQSFVRDLTKDPNGDTSIVTAIIAMAKGLKLNIIAEGVETEKQLDLLQAMDCDEMQGFLFSWPLSADEATKLLTESQGRSMLRATHS
jgi:diguanylate cyclase (GGDEF)-like protein/PAS domain S-box-containing protein